MDGNCQNRRGQWTRQDPGDYEFMGDLSMSLSGSGSGVVPGFDLCISGVTTGCFGALCLWVSFHACDWPKALWEYSRFLKGGCRL